MPDPLYIFSNLTFGNAIVLNGLIRVLARKHQQIEWVVPVPFIHAVRRTISDVQNVQVLGTHDAREVYNRWLPRCSNRLCLGEFSGNADWTDDQFYSAAGVDYNCRWTECRFPAETLRGYKSAKKSVALIYESREHQIRPELVPPGLDIFKISNRESALDWLPEIFSAAELHFIESSYLQLAESLYAMNVLKDARMVFHRYAKTGRPIELRAPWETL